VNGIRGRNEIDKNVMRRNRGTSYLKTSANEYGVPPISNNLRKTYFSRPDPLLFSLGAYEATEKTTK
jgi:hypothetical protein